MWNEGMGNAQEMLDVVTSVSVLLLLAVASIGDMKKQKIPLWLLVAGTVVGGALGCAGGRTAWEWGCSVLPGAGMILLAFVTGEKVGYGDGFFLIVLGMLEGAGKCLADLGAGLFLASVVSLVLLVGKRVNGRTRLPFVPFLLSAHVVLIMVTI